MTLFSFQALRPDGSVFAGDRRDLPSCREIWGHLEAIAIQLRDQRDLKLLVRDEDDGIVALSSVAAIIDALERCRNTDCPIKDLLGAPEARIGACAPCMTIQVQDIPRLDPSDHRSR